MRKLQCYLFVLKRPCICYYTIGMAVPSCSVAFSLETMLTCKKIINFLQICSHIYNGLFCVMFSSRSQCFAYIFFSVALKVLLVHLNLRDFEITFIMYGLYIVMLTLIMRKMLFSAEEWVCLFELSLHRHPGVSIGIGIQI